MDTRPADRLEGRHYPVHLATDFVDRSVTRSRRLIAKLTRDVRSVILLYTLNAGKNGTET